MPRVAVSELRAALESRAAELGFEPARSALLADHFLDAEMRGARGHGAERMRWLHGLGGIAAGTAARDISRTEGLVRYDAEGVLGYVALAETLQRELADPPGGARLLVLSHCFPTGRLGYFAEIGARAGLVTLVTATSTPRITHPQGGPPLLGTNPLCLALPGDPPAVVDVSMGSVTYGTVLTAAAEGRELPEGAGVRPDGSAERDPAEIVANRAGIAPFGADQAHKGFALALLVELLCGALAGLDGHGAVVLLARTAADPLPTLRAGLNGRHMPGEGSLGRLGAARAAGAVDLPADLWHWLRRS